MTVDTHINLSDQLQYDIHEALPLILHHRRRDGIRLGDGGKLKLRARVSDESISLRIPA